MEWSKTETSWSLFLLEGKTVLNSQTPKVKVRSYPFCPRGCTFKNEKGKETETLLTSSNQPHLDNHSVRRELQIVRNLHRQLDGILTLERRVVRGFPKMFNHPTNTSDTVYYSCFPMTESQMPLIPTTILDFGIGECVSLCWRYLLAWLLLRSNILVTLRLIKHDSVPSQVPLPLLKTWWSALSSL